MASYPKRKSRRRGYRGKGLLAGIFALGLLVSIGALTVKLLSGGDLPGDGVKVPTFVEEDFIPLNRFPARGQTLKRSAVW